MYQGVMHPTDLWVYFSWHLCLFAFAYLPVKNRLIHKIELDGISDIIKMQKVLFLPVVILLQMWWNKLLLARK